MDKTIKTLKYCFWSSVAIAAIVAVLFEVGLLPDGVLAGTDANLEFVLTSLMELLTVCAIPLMLRLFKFEAVRKKIAHADHYLPWAMLRMATLLALLLVNTLLYYLFMNVAFGYMALILVLCLFFVLPSKARCEAEVEQANSPLGATNSPSGAATSPSDTATSPLDTAEEQLQDNQTDTTTAE